MESGEMSRALATMHECWPQPFKRSPVEDGRNMVLPGTKAGSSLGQGR